jgi:hypothetical protein
MGEAKNKENAAIDGRELFGKVQQKRRSPYRDRFGRMIQEGDVIMSPGLLAAGLPMQIRQIVPATGPNMPPGAAWLDVHCRSRILVQPGIPMEDILLLIPAQEAAAETEQKPADAMDAGKPGEIRTPSGIILSDPDGRSER